MPAQLDRNRPAAAGGAAARRTAARRRPRVPPPAARHQLEEHRMPQSMAIVWITNREARVFRFGDADVAEGQLRADAPVLALKHRTAMQAGNMIADLALLDRVIDALRGVRTWRLTGPDAARDYLLGYLEQYKNRDGHVSRLL